MVFPNHIESLEPKYPTLRELIENDMIDLSEMSYAELYGLDDQVAGVLTIYSSTSGNSSLTSLGLQGHAWITVRNYQKTRSYGTKSLSSNQFCSIGTWPSFITGYNGVWYIMKETNDLVMQIILHKSPMQNKLLVLLLILG